MPDRNSLEAEIGGSEIEVPVPIPVKAGPDAVVAVDVAESVSAAVDEEDRREATSQNYQYYHISFCSLFITGKLGIN